MLTCPHCPPPEPGQPMKPIWRDATDPARDTFECPTCKEIFAMPQLEPELYPEYQGRKWKNGKLLFGSAGSSR